MAVDVDVGDANDASDQQEMTLLSGSSRSGAGYTNRYPFNPGCLVWVVVSGVTQRVVNLR